MLRADDVALATPTTSNTIKKRNAQLDAIGITESDRRPKPNRMQLNNVKCVTSIGDGPHYYHILWYRRRRRPSSYVRKPTC